MIHKKIISSLIRCQNFAQFYTQQSFSIVNHGLSEINIVIQYEKCNLRPCIPVCITRLTLDWYYNNDVYYSVKQ